MLGPKEKQVFLRRVLSSWTVLTHPATSSVCSPQTLPHPWQHLRRQALRDSQSPCGQRVQDELGKALLFPHASPCLIPRGPSPPQLSSQKLSIWSKSGKEDPKVKAPSLPRLATCVPAPGHGGRTSHRLSSPTRHSTCTPAPSTHEH